jgi:putative ABC transport system permease protein
MMLILNSLKEGISIALESIRANKLRSGLTILGVAVGVGVVVMIAAMVTGIRQSITEGFDTAGPNNFSVSRFDFTGVRISMGNHRPPWWNRPRIEPEEAEYLVRLPGVREALYNFNFNTTMSVDAQIVRGIQSNVYSAGWPAYTPGDFTAGRDFTPQEVRQSRPLVVLSVPLSQELFGELDPIGRKIRVSAGRRDVSEAFRVVGVFQNEENIFSAAVKHWAIFPYSSGMKRLKVSNWQAGIWVVPHDSVTQADAMDQVIGAMRSMRKLRPKEDNNFSILTSKQIVEAFDKFTGIFLLVMLALSSVGLLVGGVGVIGIMMISVTERTREIGIRKAVGATRKEILWQFLVESTVLTLLGGVTGMALGGGSAKVVAAMTPIPATVPIWAILAALAMAIITGILFGIIPALKASRLDPIHALRFE